MTKEPIPAGVKLLLVAMASGTFAVSVLSTVVGLQVFAISERELDLGLVGLAQFIPLLILSPFTGTLADRFDRRVVYGVGLAIDCIATLALLVYAAVGPTSVAPILLFIVIYGIGRALGTPAGRALPIDLAPKGSVERIVALRSLTFQIALIVGPVVGALANKVSLVLPYVIVLVMQVIAIVLLRGVPNPSTDKLRSAPGPKQAIRDTVEGFDSSAAPR